MNKESEKKLFLVDTDVFGKDSEYNQKIVSFLLAAKDCGEFDVCFAGDQSKLSEIPDSLNTSEVYEWQNCYNKRIDILLSDNDDLKLYPKYRLNSGSGCINHVDGFNWFIESYDETYDYGAMDRSIDGYETRRQERKDLVAAIVKEPKKAFKLCLEEDSISALMAQIEDTELVYVYSQENLKKDLFFIFERAVLGEDSEVEGQRNNILKQAQMKYPVSEQDVNAAVKAVTQAALQAERNSHAFH